MRKKKSLRQLKKELWRVFSIYIRRRDNGTCISCGKKDDWTNTDCGHYIPKTAGLSIYFEPRNCHAQCTACNRFRHGNLAAYAIALRQKYGPTILEELDAKRREVKKYTRAEYEALIEKYKNLI